MACDACGCSVNGVGVGLMATYRQNFLGFQYQYAPFRSTLEHAQGATDYFHSFELMTRFRVFRRFNLQLNQPYRLTSDTTLMATTSGMRMTSKVASLSSKQSKTPTPHGWAAIPTRTTSKAS